MRTWRRNRRTIVAILVAAAIAGAALVVVSTRSDTASVVAPATVRLQCSRPGFAFDVPAEWMASPTDSCESELDSPVTLNAPSIADEILRCACYGPLWVTVGAPTIVATPANATAASGAPESVTVHDMWETTRGDGVTIRWFDHTDADDAAGERQLLTAIIELDDRPVHVVANRTPDHAEGGHQWQDTLDAQLAVIETLVPRS